MFRLLATAGGLVACSPSANAEDCFGPPEQVIIADVHGPAGMVLADGRTVRLADIAADAGLHGVDAATAIAALSGTVATLLPAAGLAADRYGRIHGDVVVKDTQVSVRETLIHDGLALVDPADMSAPCLSALFGTERSAEGSERGLWSGRGPVVAADDPDLARQRGRYVIVDGTVAGIGETDQTIYLNFGANWRTDFTALIRRGNARAWAGDVKALSGERVRIRGVLEAWNGGLIRIEHPSQIERPERGLP